MKIVTSYLSPTAKRFGPYVHLLRMGLIAVVILSISRASLVAWHYDRVMAAAHLPTLLLQGLRSDIILICFFALVPVLVVPLLAWNRWSAIWFKGTYIWCLVALLTMLFLELATPAFLMQFDSRPNRIFIEYLKYPKEVLSTLVRGFPIPFIGGIALTVLLGYGAHRLLHLRESPSLSWSATKNLLVWVVVLIALVMGARSTTHHRPANPALFAITGDSMVNSIVINSTYSVLWGLYSMRHEARSSEIYGKLPVEEMLKRSLDWPWSKNYTFGNPAYPTLHFQKSVKERARPLNLVIVLQESMGATFVESLGGVNATPELEKLSKEGIWFEHLYATGTRSVRGIEAVVAGFLPTPAQSVVKLSNSQNKFTTLASILKNAGFQTQFIYGGEAHFDNMRGFFTSNGFEDIVDLEHILNPAFVGSWGASDEDLFNTAHQELQALHQSGKPFFSLIFTSSNHEPFEFPDNRITLMEHPKNRVNNAVKYADWAMGKFFENAKSSAYWEDTVFLIVADHDNRVYGTNLVPVEKFKIPGLILGGAVQPERISAISSQIDLAPTLLSLIGVSACHPMVGRDFTQDKLSPGRAALQFGDYFALMEPQYITLLKPDQSAHRMHYDEEHKKLSAIGPASNEDRVRALALVQLPSYLYRESKYRSDAVCNQ